MQPLESWIFIDLHNASGMIRRDDGAICVHRRDGLSEHAKWFYIDVTNHVIGASYPKIRITGMDLLAILIQNTDTRSAFCLDQQARGTYGEYKCIENGLLELPEELSFCQRSEFELNQGYGPRGGAYVYASSFVEARAYAHMLAFSVHDCMASFSRVTTKDRFVEPPSDNPPKSSPLPRLAADEPTITLNGQTCLLPICLLLKADASSCRMQITTDTGILCHLHFDWWVA